MYLIKLLHIITILLTLVFQNPCRIFLFWNLRLFIYILIIKYIFIYNVIYMILYDITYTYIYICTYIFIYIYIWTPTFYELSYLLLVDFICIDPCFTYVHTYSYLLLVSFGSLLWPCEPCIGPFEDPHGGEALLVHVEGVWVAVCTQRRAQSTYEVRGSFARCIATYVWMWDYYWRRWDYSN